MNLCEWNAAYTKITNKLNKKKPLTTEEIDELILTDSERAMLHFLRPGEYVLLKEAEKYLKLKHSMAVVKSLLDKKYIQVKEVVEELFREKVKWVITLAQSFTEEEYGQLFEKLKRAPMQHRVLHQQLSNPNSKKVEI